MANSWTALPEGDSLDLPAGALVAIVASVKASHTAAELQAFATKHGIALADYAEEGQRAGLGPDPRGPGYRYVAAAGTVGAGGLSLPWDVPWPLSIVDGSTLVTAWQGAAGAGPAPPPPVPVVQRTQSVPGGGAVLVGFGLAGAALWLAERKPWRRGRVTR